MLVCVDGRAEQGDEANHRMCARTMAVSIGLMDAEPERPGRLGRKLLGSACDLSALLSDGFELAPRMRGGQYHDLDIDCACSMS